MVRNKTLKQVLIPKDLRKAKNSVTNDYKTCKFVKEVYNIAMIDHTIKKRCCFSNNHKTINNSVSDCFSLTNFKNQCWLVIKKLFLLSSLHLTCSDGLFWKQIIWKNCQTVTYKIINYKYSINLILLLHSKTNADQSDKLLSMSELWP